MSRIHPETVVGTACWIAGAVTGFFGALTLVNLNII
jgi:hypothetical protein